MTASAFILILTHQKPLKIAKGSDVSIIGKVRPGTYSANREPRSLPTLNDLNETKQDHFTGNLYVIPADKNARPEVIAFWNGKKRTFNKQKGVPEYGDTLRQVVSSLGEKVDVRIAEATYAHFTVTLPAESKKLAGFDGSITYFIKDMKPKEALTIWLKAGKVVSTMP